MTTDFYDRFADRESYDELFTVGHGFVHVLDEPLLRPPERDRRRRLWLAALAVWAVAGLCLAVLAVVLSFMIVGREALPPAPEDHVISIPLATAVVDSPSEASPAREGEPSRPALAGLGGLPMCGLEEPTCDGTDTL